MRSLILIAIVVVSFVSQAKAQGDLTTPDIVKDPICFQVRNSADFTMYGNFGTDFYTTPSGTQARHRSNFRLEAAGSIDEDGYPADRAEFCSYGPFFEGRKLELQIRTLFPVFACTTRIDQGEIVLRADRKQDNTGYNYYADCYE
jgi:hypothetical protein